MASTANGSATNVTRSPRVDSACPANSSANCLSSRNTAGRGILIPGLCPPSPARATGLETLSTRQTITEGTDPASDGDPGPDGTATPAPPGPTPVE
ncbi:hypothetical protein Lfu02_64460 [Longispora fulva]|nr:hypothetical protein Lfu02_64460 [Longispora fulva]